MIINNFIASFTFDEIVHNVDFLDSILKLWRNARIISKNGFDLRLILKYIQLTFQAEKIKIFKKKSLFFLTQMKDLWIFLFYVFLLSYELRPDVAVTWKFGTWPARSHEDKDNISEYSVKSNCLILFWTFSSF